MKPVDLLEKLHERRITLSIVDGDLCVLGNELALNDLELLGLLRENKHALIDVIKNGGAERPTNGLVDVPPNRILPESDIITPEMLPLVRLSTVEIEKVVSRVSGGVRNVQDIYPLAPLQEGILFHHLLEREGDPYLASLLMKFDDHERLYAYVRSLQAVVDRHDILRTAVQWEGLREPVQVVWRRAVLVVEKVDLHPRDGDIAEQLQQRFDSRRYRLDVRRAPLLRICVAQDVISKKWVAVNLMHHLVCDNASTAVISDEVKAHLIGEEAKLPRPLPFRNLVAQARRGVKREEQEAFFSDMLGDVEEPTAPFGLVEVQGDGRSDDARRTVDAELVKRLRRRARALGVSMATLWHVAFAQVLSRVSGREDVVFGTVLLGRMQAGEGSDRILGLCINTLPIRIRIADECAEAGVLRTHELLAKLFRHEHASLAVVQRCSKVAAPTPLFTAVFNYRRSATESATVDSTRAWEGIETIGGETRTNYPLVLSVDDWGEEMGVVAQVQGRVDAGAVCELMYCALEGLAKALEHTPGRALRELDVLPARERYRLLVQWNAIEGAYPQHPCVHELFEASVAEQPEAVAVVNGEAQVTYGELNERANRLAHWLRRGGVKPEVRVGICVERSSEMVVGLLAIVKAGGAYVPLDPSYPEERLSYMIGDSRPRMVLTDGRSAARLQGSLGSSQTVVLDLEADAWRWEKEARSNPESSGWKNERLAYVIYTSGSTGKPKGVMVEHGNVRRLFSTTDQRFEVGREDVWTQCHSVAFDFSVWEIWGALAHGARLVIAGLEVVRDPVELYELVCRSGATVLSQTPSAFRQLMVSSEGSKSEHALRYVVFGGEALEVTALQGWYEQEKNRRTQLVNMYGVTETTVHSTYRALEARDAERGGASPIGERLPDLRIYILDKHGRPAPVGVTGELHVAGAGVSRGYQNRAAMTAERFVPDPYGEEPGGRMYKTGDLGRYLDKGEIEFLGRNDLQVKVRGFRIELGEIEARLSECAGVEQAVVIAREDRAGDKRLVAYYTGESGVSAEELRAKLSEALPEYMVPAAYVRLNSLPLTLHGKLDRKALPAPERGAYGAGGYEAPVGVVETELARLWSEVLKVERVGRRDNFFALGGHSLLAVSLMERMRQAQLHADVRAVFAAPTLMELAAAIRSESGVVEVPPNGIPVGCEVITPEMLPLIRLSEEEIESVVSRVPGGAANVQDIYPLAPLQEGMLFHHLLERESDPYVTSTMLGFATLEGVERYIEALQVVVERHDILRTAVQWEGLPEPVQVVWRRAPVVVERLKLGANVGDVVSHMREQFDPKRYRLELQQAPLLRLFVARDEVQSQWVMLTLSHHMVTDHTAMEIVGQEIDAIVEGKKEELPRPLPFRNFVAQARLGARRAEHEAFFGKMLGDVEEPTAPFGLTNVQGDGREVRTWWREVEPTLVERLRRRARALGISTASICHLAWAQVLARTSGRDDVVFGTVLFGRMQGGEGADRVLGLFLNTLPIRIRIGNDGAEESARRTHLLLAELLRHEHASLAVAQRCSRVVAPAPLFSALLNYRHIGAPRASANGSRAREDVKFLGAQERTNYPIALSVNDLGEEMGLTAQVQAPADAEAVCELMHCALENLLRALESAPETAMRQLDVLPPRERQRQLLDWNATEAWYPKDKCVHELFEARAAEQPDAVALVHGEEQVTYGELNGRANQLARELSAMGVRAGERIVTLLGRSIELVVAKVGIVKCGAVYVPLDESAPEERRGWMVEDCQAKVVLTAKGRKVSEALGAAVVELERGSHSTAYPPNVDRSVGSEATACVMYTSGSTGKPKGVEVPHRAIGRLLVNNGFAKLGRDDRAAFVSNPAFDPSLLEVWGPLSQGGKIVVVDHETILSPTLLKREIELEEVSYFNFTAVLLSQFASMLGDALSRLRYLQVGGDVTDARVVDWVLKNHAPESLVHCYGPTETALFATTYRVEEVPEGATRLPIGRPISNTRVYVLDTQGEPVPVGAVGEICIGGAGVANGYVNRPELTAERFVPEPWSNEPGARIYRTGDLGRYRAEGNLEFIGRSDGQVKLRGFRIELGEIEARLRQCSGVGEAVVVARENEAREKQLVAYYTAQGQRREGVLSDGASAAGDAQEPEKLRAHLGRFLPEYMVPSAYVQLESLPLTPHGKLDRKALPAPERAAYGEGDFEAPIGEVETTLARLWSELLQVERVGRGDNFLRLGGHSLLVVRLMERMRREGLHADVRAVFSAPTLTALAEVVGTESNAIEVPANGIAAGSEVITPSMLPLVKLSEEEIAEIVSGVPGGAKNVQDIYPLAPLQEGILFHHLLEKEGDPYLGSQLLRFESRERVDAYVRSLQAVIDRHDILRTAVQWEGLGEPVQVVWRRAALVVEEVDVDPRAGDIAEQLRKRFDSRHYRLDVRQAPLLRLCVAQDVKEQKWLAIRLMHHLLGDNTSAAVISEEVEAYLLGEEKRLVQPLPFRNLVAQTRLGANRVEQEVFFSEMLGDVEESTAPFGLMDVRGDGRRTDEAQRRIAPELARRLGQRARALGISPASVCHLAWAQVLSRASGRSDVVFGTVLLGRMLGGEGADRVPGMFINTLPVRIRIGNEGVEAAVVRTHKLLTELLRHEHASLAVAQRCSKVAAPAPLFTALFNYRYDVTESASEEASRAWEGIETIGGESRTSYPLAFSVNVGEEMSLSAQVQAPADAEVVCELMHCALEGLVRALENTPGMPVRQLDVLPSGERQRLLLEWNATEAWYPKDKCVHELFEARAAEQLEAVALVHGEEQISYGELNARANHLARELCALEVRPGDRVATVLARSIDLVVAEVAIVKCGAVYVPLDENAPAERRAWTIDDCQAKVVLTAKGAKGRRVEGASGGSVIELEMDSSTKNFCSPREGHSTAYSPNVERSVGSEATACVMYTSGSTGKPKGVEVPHRAIGRLLVNNGFAKLGRDDRVAFVSNPAFDPSLLEVWGPLSQGGRIVVVDHETILSPTLLKREIELEEVSYFNFTAVLLSQFASMLGDALSRLRYLQVGGDVTDARVVDWVLKNHAPESLVHCYGPTETALFATTYRVEEVPEGVTRIPIGRPISNTRVYVLDKRGEPVPVGAIGEIWIGGAGVANGYLNRPELTAERFVPEPWSNEPGARIYRTGDLGRHRADGNLEFIGRSDSQVKIRGFRVELGEIESVLKSFVGVGQAVVIAREEIGGDKRLVAYYTATEGEVDAKALSTHLAKTLPDYMVPAAYEHLASIPLTAHGKVNREALPAPGNEAYAIDGYEAPVGEVEEELARLWSEVLKVERVGRGDNFFKLGGHSLVAVSLMERMRRQGMRVDVRAVLGAPTLMALAAAVGKGGDEVEVPPNGIGAGCEKIEPWMLTLVKLSEEEIERVVSRVPGGAANVQDIYPLAPLQEGMLFHYLLGGKGDVYLSTMVMSFESRERLEAYIKGREAVIQRHDILRTAIQWEGLPEPVQVVWRRAGPMVEEVSIDPAGGDVVEQLRKRFDPLQFRLDIGRAPLSRLFVAHDADRARWVVLVLNHHLTGDHTATDLIQEEIQAYLLGRGDSLPTPLPFRNLVAQACLGVSREKQEMFFRELLGDVETPTLPYGLSDVLSDGRGVASARRRIRPELAKRLRERARALGASAAVLCHLAWAQVLARVSGQDDVVFGTVLFGRMQGGEGADRAIGLFMNTLPVRIQLGSRSVAESVRTTRELLAQLAQHEHTPLALAQRCSRVDPPNPLFAALFNYRHGSLSQPSVEAEQAWKGAEFLGAEERTAYPILLSVDDWGDEFGLAAQAQAPANPADLCDLMETALAELVNALEVAPETPVGRLDVLPEGERRRVLLEWNQIEALAAEEPWVHELVEARAWEQPDAVAVVHEEEQISYGEVNERANRLAHGLQRWGVKPEVRVGICVERSIELVVGMLAILKAGGAYVPLDPSYPMERLAYMIEDSRLGLILTHGETGEALRSSLEASASERKTLDVEADAWRWAMEPSSNPGRNGMTKEHLAYVIYTSGSTGKPKGVMVEHGNARRLFSAMDRLLDLGGEEVWTQCHLAAFDFSVWEIWGALAHGARLVIAGGQVVRSPTELYELVCRSEATVMSQTPSAFRQLMVASEASASTHRLQYVVFGGEALEWAMLKPWYGRTENRWTRLVNMYGPTETTVFSTCRALDACDAERSAPPSIGERLPDLKVYILDRQGRAAPMGVMGELYIAGAGVSRGYQNRPDMTAERFVPDPHGEEPGARMYKTGDLGRYVGKGEIEFLGRNDLQVKVRGFRIELGEIEARLNEYPGVKYSVVIAREDTLGDKRLVAYYTGEAGLRAEELRARLTETLPEHMVPAAYVKLDSLPLTAHGKLDRKALPAPEREAYAAEGYEEPVGVVENELARLWSEILKVDRVGRRDNFFALGGHSLLAVTLMERMRRVGMRADVRAVLGAPTLMALAAMVRDDGEEVEVPPNGIPLRCERIVPAMLPLVKLSEEEIERIVGRVAGGASNVQDIYPLAPLQEGMLYHHLAGDEGDVYLSSMVLSFDRREHIERYVGGLQAVIERHDILRTAIEWEGLPEPVQVVWRRAPLMVEEVAVEAGIDVATQLAARFDPRKYRLELTQAPLMRLCVAEDCVNGAWVAVHLRHHLVGDNVSAAVISAEVQAHLSGRMGELPAAVPFRNFVAQARLGIGQAEHEAFFKKTLGDVEETTAAYGLTDVEGRGKVKGGRRAVEERLGERMRERARRLGVSAASLCHMAWGMVLARTSGREDVVFGTVILGRMAGGEATDRAVGLFMNTLPLRLRIGSQGVERSVRRTHELLAELLRHEHASLALAQRCSGVAAPAPLFTALFNYRHTASRTTASQGQEGLAVLGGGGQTNYPIALSVNDDGAAFELDAQVQAPAEPEALCEMMHRALEVLVDALEKTPETPVGTLDVLSAKEKQRLEEWNATEASYPRDRCVHELFEERAEAQPDAVAVVEGEEQITYGELNGRANGLAKRLRAMGVKAGDRVATQLERSVGLVMGELAIVKCGAAYVPLDEHAPEARKAWIMEDCQAKVLLTRKGRTVAEGLRVEVVELQAEELSRDGYAPDIGGSAGSEATAYVMYTSGSTGKPKGVEVPHRALVSLVVNKGYAKPNGEDRVAFVANAAFDPSTQEVWGALVEGGKIVVMDHETVLSPELLKETVEVREVTFLHLPSVLFNQYASTLGETLSRLRCLQFGGDVVDRGVVDWVWRNHAPEHIVHAYGPTETTLFATTYEVKKRPEGAASVPIGRPISNARVYVVNAKGQAVPEGAIGEICISGAGVARGYLNRPDLTAERFVPDPWSNEAGARVYQTGDRGRRLADGNLEFVGRSDAQVKIRGFRVELGEVEGALKGCLGVEQAVVIAREDVAGEKRLVGYYTGDSGLSAEDLRGRLSGTLPEYMVPAAFVRVESWPLTLHGKLNRKALPVPEREAYGAADYEPPDGDVEARLAQLWSEVLKVDRVGRNDNFFDLGGNSLLVVKLLSRINSVFEPGLTMREVLAAATVRGMAQRLDEIKDGKHRYERMVGEEECYLDPSLVFAGNVAPGRPRLILLTGVTGFVGAFLLQALLEQTEAEVHCLVRAASESAARDRIGKVLVRYGIRRDACDPRIHVVEGDLTARRLGLTASAFAELAGRVDSIFHVGAHVHHTLPYERLKAANVSGTAEILRLVANGRPKTLHHISTLSVFEGVPKPRRISEDTPLASLVHSHTAGYSASKWVAERLVETAISRGAQCTIYRLGRVGGDTVRGATNLEDQFCRLLMSCASLRAFPAEPTFRESIFPADVLGRAIVALALNPFASGTVHHLQHPEHVELEAMMKVYSVLYGHDVVPLPLNEWVARLRRAVDAGIDIPMLPYLPMFETMTKRGDTGHPWTEYDNLLTQRRLSEHGVALSPIDNALAAKYWQFLEGAAPGGPQ